MMTYPGAQLGGQSPVRASPQRGNGLVLLHESQLIL